MRLFRNTPIKRKLVIITMSTSGAALLLACLAFVVYEMVVFRETMVDDLSITAAMVGDNSSAALTFNDPASAEQTLKSLGADSHIVAAAVYGADGKVFARYRPASLRGPFNLPGVAADGYRFDDDYLALFHRFRVAGEVAGTVYIQSDLEAMRARLRRYTVIVALVMTVATLLAYLLSRMLQATISAPISLLASVVGVVAQQKNYSIRALKQSEDELGQLIDGFNEMLRQIQSRDTALRAARDGLEQRVDERTRELQREITERTRAEQALRVQEERTRLIIDKAFDAIVSTDIDGRVLGWNTQAEAVFGWSATEAVGRNLTALIIPPQHREAHRAGLKQFVATGAGPILNRRVEVVGLCKDGREIPIELAVTPIRVGDSFLFNAFLRDITERKKAEAELTAAHKQLVDISRAAGMAEVATGVLHNVGNVLNSVNVSANLLTEYVQKSKASGLARVVALLREHEHDLGEFVTRDAQGKHLPAHLANLAQHLVAEREAAVKELDALRGNVEHIKDIVTMQQSYAKIAGVQEQIKVTDLVEDSLRLNAGALTRHRVEVIREFEDDPIINVDKHKVLQILVNLVGNAKYACQEAGRTDRRVTLRVKSGEGRVRILVEDNGVGIAPENLIRVFSHGFTTRKAGHGFGLHSGALAARELGGSLSVHSEGVGLGAAFTLDLPLESGQTDSAREAGYG